MRTYKKFFYVMLVIVFLSSIVSLIVPICLQIWNSDNISFTKNRIVLIAAILVLTNILNLILIIYREKFAENYNQKNFSAIMDDYLDMNYDAILQEGPSNIAEKIVMGVNSIYTYMTGTHIQIWASVLIATISIILIASSNIYIASIMLTYICISYFGYKILNNELTKRSIKLQEETGLGFQELISYIQEPDYYKQLDDYSEVLSKIESAGNRLYSSMASVNILAQSASSVIEGIGSLLQNIIFILMIYGYGSESISAFFLLMMMILLPLFFSSVSTITNSNINKKDYLAAIAVHQRIIEEKERYQGIDVGEIKRIDFNIKELYISGERIEFIAKGTICKGDIARINGESGAGKSTLAKTLVKFRTTEGIKINGIDINEISTSVLRHNIEYVSQNIPIIKGTLRDNIMFGKQAPNITDEYLNAIPLLQSILINKSLDSEIFEGGLNLSGGEKQKIAIVRALINNPKVLILDEVCSNIDGKVSNEIYDVIKREKDRRITIIITHEPLPEGLVNVEI